MHRSGQDFSSLLLKENIRSAGIDPTLWFTVSSSILPFGIIFFSFSLCLSLFPSCLFTFRFLSHALEQSKSAYFLFSLPLSTSSCRTSNPSGWFLVPSSFWFPGHWAGISCLSSTCEITNTDKRWCLHGNKEILSNISSEWKCTLTYRAPAASQLWLLAAVCPVHCRGFRDGPFLLSL